MKDIIKTSKSAFSGSRNPVSSATEGFDMLVKAYAEYKVVCETEHTKRVAISAWKEVQVTKTNNQRASLELYLKESFVERRHVIDEMFKRLDDGIESNNPELISMAMTAIENTVKSSPLHNASQMLAAMKNPSANSIEF